jgi:ribonuclease P protein component
LTEGKVAKRSGMLRKRSEFEAVLRSGLRLASRNFVLRAQANAVACARLGIIAGRKSAARAVDRNRGKRIIREVFRAARPGLGLYDVTIQLRNDLRAETNDSVRAELRKLLDALARFGSAEQPPRTGDPQ